MKLEQLFDKDVARPIEGVIKADDESSLLLELDEYVITDEVGKRLDEFLDAYLNYAGANGVWISGFFGSGKSHLLKMLALLLENRELDGSQALDVFLQKPKCRDDEIFASDLKRAVAIPSESILFNIDQKADVISKTELDALIAVFVKVFDEHCGYYGKQAYIAQFERELDTDGLLEPFTAEFEASTGKDWDWGRARAKRMAAEIDAVYNKVTGQEASGILDKYRTDYRLSIEDFAEQVSDYIAKKGDDFRLNFFVDEVGQYVADNVKLMTNLQTVAESLATKCNGQAWVIVTAQEDMQSVVGDAGKQQSNDFSKIQARFKNRMKLTSQDVAEVIQRRLLHKKEEHLPELTDLFHAQENNFKTLFDFADGGQTYRNFRDKEHFIQSYPFIPYQFSLFQAAIQNLSTHNAFEGKHSSVGERSMLGVFQQVAIAIKGHETGDLATFDLMFEGIRTALKTAIQQSVINAEKNLGNEFAIRLLKALFLVKYVKEFKPTVRNLCVLMHDSFGRDIPSLKTEVEEALNLLEKETYIQRNGELYEYLTDEEQDVEQEIKNTEVDSSAVATELEKLIFDGVLKTRKIRWDENNQDYPFSRRLDDNLVGREHELSINVVTSFHEYPDAEEKHRTDTAFKDEVVVLLPASERLVRDLLLYKQTEKYVAHETRATQQDSIKRILTEKGVQNGERLNQLKALARKLVSQAKFFVAGQELELGGEDGQSKMFKAFFELIKRTYPNLKMLRDVQFSENEVPNILREAGQGLFSDDAALPESQQEMLSTIQANHRGGVRTTVKSLIDKFERKPYGWSYGAILCTLAYLCGRGKVEVRESTNLLDDAELAKALRNTAAHPNLILDPQVEFTQSQIRAVKEFHKDMFDQLPTASEAKALAQEVRTAFQDLESALTKLVAQSERYPFLRVLKPVITDIEELKEKPYTWYIGELINQEDRWLDLKEDTLDSVGSFMKGAHKSTYDAAADLLTGQKANLSYVEEQKAKAIEALLLDPKIYKGMQLQQLKQQTEAIQAELSELIATERQTAVDKIENLKQTFTGYAAYSGLDLEKRNALTARFDATKDSIGEQNQIAVIRDSVRRFEDEEYPRLVQQLVPTEPKPEPKQDGSAGGDDKPSDGNGVAEPRGPQMVSARNIKVTLDKPWLETEQDLDDYLEQYREALLSAIKEGKRVQV